MTEATVATHGGEHHWALQRTTAIANLFLGSWLAVSLALMPDYNYPTIVGWLSGTLPSLAMILLIVSFFWHARLGLQVLIEDYVHDAGYRFTALALVNLAAIAGATAGVLFVVRIVALKVAGDLTSSMLADAMAGAMGGAR